MTLPEEFKVLIITLSDRASRGEYEDLSGPAIKKYLTDFFRSVKWRYSVKSELIPDDAGKLRLLLTDAAENFNIVFTTGGTGIGPRDITPDTVRPLLSKEIPGIMEFIRCKYGMSKPQALLSRSVAGIAGKALIYTLPGSVKAVEEYMTEILKTLEHVVLMQYSIDLHGKC
ncbi:MAG: MogA/MoaB family molybdenum cofactor biosynthesis protein [Bacteroidales bacterium]|nr:MogA/MoaB family molybdenum cofactor biosynthesis protein [Bacteroidales bacterium]